LLISAKVTLANGRSVVASETENADLFWALRGGAGGSFGLATEFTFKTLPIPDRITVFNFFFDINPGDEWKMAKLMKLLQAQPNEMGTRLSLYKDPDAVLGRNSEGFVLNFMGQWLGDKQHILDLIADCELEEIPNRLYFLEDTNDYWAAQGLIKEVDYIRYSYRETSTYISRPLSAEDISKAMELLANAPPCDGKIDLRFFQVGGKINAVAPDATAYVHRDSEWIMLIGVYCEQPEFSLPKYDENFRDWQNDAYAVMRDRMDGKGAYQNFPDAMSETWEEDYFRSNYPKLQESKKKWDPEDVFNFAQSVRLP